MAPDTTTNDGGPAFPGTRLEKMPPAFANAQYPGMSLRDYFAGQALADYRAFAWRAEGTLATDIAGTCYAIADAMIAARAKAEGR
jgi:hypothetical protein